MALPTSRGANASDRAYMRAALGLARRGLGNTAPNPNVGCVIVHPDHGIVGRGWTQPGGRPHAETEALKRAGTLANGAHAYVTLEPCNHRGQTGPCTEALIDAGIAAVIIAIQDPDPRVAGSGIERLAAAGISVTTGVLNEDARHVTAGFLSVIERNRPWVTLKTATTMDGKIAAKNGNSQWITGPAARRRGHWLRAQNDALLTGIGTVLADDPQMTCRLPGLASASPIRVVLDSNGRLSATHMITAEQETARTLQVTRTGVQPIGEGIETIAVAAGKDGHVDPTAVLAYLASIGVTRVLLEAGGAVSASFMRADLVDEIAWFRAPRILGGDALSAFGDFDLQSPDVAARFSLHSTLSLDDDVLERYLRAGVKEA